MLLIKKLYCYLFHTKTGNSILYDEYGIEEIWKSCDICNNVFSYKIFSDKRNIK